jgi:hypothetical protein
MTETTAVPVVSLDLDAIEARAAAVTEGPWGFRGRGVGTEYEDGRKPRVIADTFRQSDNDMAGKIGNWAATMRQDAANGEFIAQARADVPALVDALRRARDCAAALEQENALLTEQREAALALHRQNSGAGWHCVHDALIWPCPTARALGTTS